MRRRCGQHLRLGVALDAVCLLRQGGWRAGPPAVLAEQALAPSGAGDFTALGLALEQVLHHDNYAGWPLGIVLADDYVRMWQVALPAGMTRLADIEAASALRFQQLYGEPAAGWVTATDWDARLPFCAAAPRALLALLRQAAAARKLAIVALAPHFIQCWNRWQGRLETGAWFGLVHEQLLSIAAREGGRLRALRVLALPPAVTRAWLIQALQREAVLLDLAAPALLQVCGQAPLAWNGAAAAAPIRLQILEQDGVMGLSPAALLACAGRLV